MNKRVRKAIFPVAGFGTRFLPATKSMPKEMLPIINKPLIQYAAEEAVKAGIDTLIFITGRHKRIIEDHFDRNPELEEVLKKKGKIADAEIVANILPNDVSCVFIRQAEALGLGHAVLLAEKVVNQEPFAVILADDFIISDGEGVTSDLIKAFNERGKTQLSTMKVCEDQVSKFGIIIPSDSGLSVKGIVEKPSRAAAPSDIASIGRYVLDPVIFDILRNLSPGLNGEIQLADAIHQLAASGAVEQVPLEGKRFDCGSIRGYMDAVLSVGDRRKRVSDS